MPGQSDVQASLARRPRSGPRGRVASDAAREAARIAIGDTPPRRDLLIEYLHRLQQAHGVLREGNLVALAELMRLAPVEVFEVASFYHHFLILSDDAPAPASHVVRICEGLPCAMAGGHGLLAALRERPPPGARVVAAPCIGACGAAPACLADGQLIGHASPACFADGLPPPKPVPPRPIAMRLDAWLVLHAARGGALTRDAMLAALEDSGLRGMGGAGFPVARKWRAVMAQPGPRQLVVNADEGEPGTFKDRVILEDHTQRFLEGLLLAAHAIEAEACWIYLRDEYAHLADRIRARLAELQDAGIASTPIHLRLGAGAYICGEETALLESLEGKRGYPRHKPPYPGVHGLFGQPTLIHNVETLWWLPQVLPAPQAFAASGRRGGKGRRLFSVSGRVKRPGVYEAPNGVTARELIEEFAGGIADGHRFLAYLPGGASGGILPASMADLPLDFGVLEKHGCFVGSGAVVVLSDQDDLAETARNLLRFFRDESCGQCTPCRVGTAKAVRLLDAPRWDRALLKELAQAMADGSICGLGQAAMNPVLSLLRHFPEDAVP